MDVSLFDYDLPRELIAQHPTRNRDESRLLVLDRATGGIAVCPFRSVVDYLRQGDALVVNDTKVFKARLMGNRRSGGKVEVFLVRRQGDGSLLWDALAYPSRRLKEGEQIFFSKKDCPDRYSLTLTKALGGGKWVVAFSSALSEEKIIDAYGHVPLPPYIKRADSIEDISRYQTIFARQEKTGAVAAPTAGFHFTPTIIDRLMAKGVRTVELTLHVGPGTFKPVKVDNIEDHVIDPELASLSAEAAAALNETRDAQGAIFAVGTTSVRTLESAPLRGGKIASYSRDVDLYIRPGYEFKIVDRLLTNFHLPKSSLLILVCAFAGRERVLAAYQKAISEGFRFYSYGDAMLIL